MIVWLFCLKFWSWSVWWCDGFLLIFTIAFEVMLGKGKWFPSQGLEIGKRLVWKYEETRHTTKPTRSKSFSPLFFNLMYIYIRQNFMHSFSFRGCSVHCTIHRQITKFEFRTTILNTKKYLKFTESVKTN